ncbi:MAG TPA: STAS domain-containing protein [Micromonosporaceae bacterium]|nr:STAS domain-containing protein [Micromonosporaceae bacterium]
MAVLRSVDGNGPWVRIRLAGEIDVASTELIEQSVASALAQYADASVLEIDLTDVTLVDSTGVGVLVNTHQGLAGKGVRLIVTNPAKIVERVMRVTGVFETLTGTTKSSRR